MSKLGDKDFEDFIYNQSYKIHTQIVSNQDKETIKVIERYCKENNIIPNLIDEDKLKEVLRLGIAEYSKRQILGSGSMTVIEMLNKIAADEEYLPLGLKFYDDLFIWDACEGDWLNKDDKGFLEYNIPFSLNNNVEVFLNLKDLKEMKNE